MEKVNFVFSGAGGTVLPAVIWTPEKPRAVLQSSGIRPLG